MEIITRAQDHAEHAFGRGIQRALVAFRWLTFGWAAAGVGISWGHLNRPAAAVALLGLMGGFTILTTWLMRTERAVLMHPAMMVAELAIGAAVLLGDGWVYDSLRAQSLPWAWPAAGIIAVGIALGARLGALSALGLGVVSYFGDARTSQEDWGVAASSKTALYMLAAVVAGYVARRLRQAEIEISVARARAEVARTLHDGVLQTLAVVQRRSSDPELAALAQTQDRELRDFLFGSNAEPRSLPVALREAAALVQSRYALKVDVVVADDLPNFGPSIVDALAGAVGEALTNAAKHANAERVVVYAEPTEGGVFCSVKDDGVGFDTETTTYGQGITGSIQGRMHDAGGRIEIAGRPGRGTEVRLWI